MSTKICACCGQPFLPNPRVKNHTFCSAPACQKERRKQWRQNKMLTDRFARSWCDGVAVEVQEDSRTGAGHWCSADRIGCLSPGEPLMKTRLNLLAFTGALLLQTGFAHAQDRKIEQAIKHRKAAFTLMATYVNRMVQTVDGHRPFDAKLMTQDARTVELLSKLPWEGFVEGSERGDTRAKDDIWFEEDKFKRYANDLQAKTAVVTVAAESGDLKRFKAAVGQMREVCNTCHKAFRKD